MIPGLGRVSFNPAKHVDPFGTILLPGMLLLFHAPFLFGYAKLQCSAGKSKKAGGMTPVEAGRIQSPSGRRGRRMKNSI